MSATGIAPLLKGPQHSVVTAPKARVLVVEDDAVIRDALALAFESGGYVVRAEADAVNILDVAELFRPDVVILDVRLGPGPNGYEVGKSLRKAAGDLPILFLTAADSLSSRLKGFEAGADDYVTKPFAVAELLQRVHALLRRAGRLRSGVHVLGDLTIDESAATVSRSGVSVELTQTEYELLLALARTPNKVLSKSKLLWQVWSFDAFDPNLVEVHVSALRRKLEAHGPRIVQTVRGAGYKLGVS